MRGPSRAALALALHTGFFAVPVALVVGLGAIALVTFRYDVGSGLRAAFAALLVAVIVGLVLRSVLTSRVRPKGVPVDRAAQPDLWQDVESIATEAAARPPDEIRITSEPNACVREDTALLGLRSRRSYLEIGLPLVAGLNVSELRSVLAHEVGHLAESSKLRTMCYRATVSVEQTSTELSGGAVKWLFDGYARLYKRMASAANRSLELDADAIAVKIAGKRAAITALRKTTALEFGWREYGDEFLSMANCAERTPDVLLGFRAFLDHPPRKQDLAARAKQAIDEDRSRGLHPTTARRIEAMKKLPGGNRSVDERPAWSLLREPRRSVPALEDELLVDGLGPRVPWSELGRLAGEKQASHKAAMLSSAVLQSGVAVDPALGGVLQAIHRGSGRELVNPVLNPGLSPDNIDQAAVDTLTELLGAAVVDALVRAGRAHHVHDWGGAPQVRLTNGQPLDPDRLVRPAVVDPQHIPGLHRTLVGMGVPLDHKQPPAEDPEPAPSGLVTSVQAAGSRFELVVTDRGLVLVPSSASTAQRLLAGVLASARKQENEQLADLLSTPVHGLLAEEGAQWVDSRDVATAHWEQRTGGWTLTVRLFWDDYALSTLDTELAEVLGEDTAELELRCTPDSEERGTPYEGLGELMGARMKLDDHVN